MNIKVIKQRQLEPVARRQVDKISRGLRPTRRASFAAFELLIEENRTVVMRVKFAVYDLTQPFTEQAGAETQRNGYYTHGVKTGYDFIDLTVETGTAS